MMLSVFKVYVSGGKMVSEKDLEMVVMAQFQILSQRWPGWTEEDHEEPQPEYSVFKHRFESGTS
jgi:hypothetical protein